MSVEIDQLWSALDGRYEIEREIGSGGMAVVYLAHDILHHRPVAIKLLRREIAAAVGAERFLREIQILSELGSPRILPLFESGCLGDQPFYVMPYVNGRSLRDILDQKKFLPIDEALRLAGEVAEALDYAHGHGVVHRDIKPGNILIHDGHAVVADFGIARAIDVAAGDTITSGTLVIGTPMYMSPEQGSGERHIDGRSDIYSLACVVYEMLAGSTPYHGPTPEAIQARKTQQPMPSIRTVRPAVPEAMEDALRRALSVIPADRFGTADEFVTALRKQTLPRPRRWAAAVAALAITLAVGGVAIWSQLPKAADVAVPRRLVVSEFINRTGDRTLDAVGFMTADWLTEGLQRATAAVQVVPSLTALEASRYLRARPESTPVRMLGGLREETGADVVVSGSYYRRGDTLSFVGQITDVRIGRLLTAIGPVSAPLGDPVRAIGELRTRAMGFLASTLDERLASSAMLETAPPTYEAYQEFSAGMAAYVASDFRSASTRLIHAFRLDSTFPTPLLFASISLSNQGRYAEADSFAQILAGRRSALNPFHQAWLDYRLAFLAGDRPAALGAVRRLARRAPGSKAGYNLAVEALENGYLDEAITALRALAPDRGAMRGWIPYWELLGTAYHLKGDFDAELDAGTAAAARYPERLFALLPTVRSLAATGKHAELERVLREAVRLSPDPYGTSYGTILRDAGEEAAAHRGQPAGRPYLRRSLLWYVDRLRDSSASRRDTVAAAALLYELGESPRAAALLGSNPRGVEEVGLAGLIAASSRRVVEAESIATSLREDVRKHQLGAPYLAEARIEGLLGDTAAALGAFERAFRTGRHYDLWIHRTPELALLHNHPRYLELIRPKQ
jgi:tetratricopeptide (TPR) repeat protein